MPYLIPRLHMARRRGHEAVAGREDGLGGCFTGAIQRSVKGGHVEELAAIKALDRDEGEAIWSAGSLMVIKASAEDTRGGVTVIEQSCPPGLDSPAHVHSDEEQCLYMLAGMIEVTCGETKRRLEQGGFAVLPRGVPHSFKVGSDGARFLSLTAPAGFERFAREIGEPAGALEPPPRHVVNTAEAAAWSTHNDQRPGST